VSEPRNVAQHTTQVSPPAPNVPKPKPSAQNNGLDVIYYADVKGLTMDDA
jgi:hypothetical protein